MTFIHTEYHDELQPRCVHCGVAMPGSHIHRKYCSTKCKSRHRKKFGPSGKVPTHDCRICGKTFPINADQGNKWLCSDACRRASNAKSVRVFHLRRPTQEAIYRARSKNKGYRDNATARFYSWNPEAPRSCESCGEDRITEAAHKPSFARLGARRRKDNSKWPEMVWVLCPTCHMLIDRMGYSPAELGLTE